MNLGLLGCGNAARWLHLRALRGVPGVKLVAAVDPDPAARDFVTRATGVPAYERAEELLDRGDVEAVLICAPTHLHARLAIAVAAAGKHFYLEKPLASDAAEGRELIAAAGRAGVKTAMGFNRRLHPLFQQAREQLAAGAIGRVRAMQATICERTDPAAMSAWRRQRATGGGVLLDLASHHVDQLRWMLGQEVVAVSAALTSERTEQDGARLELETDDGVVAQSAFSFRTALTDVMELVGERGTLQLDRHAASLTVRLGRRRGYGTRSHRVLPNAAVAAWRLERLWRPPADPSYRSALRSFAAQVRGEEPRTASLVDGLRSLEVVLAAEEAARTGRPARIGSSSAPGR